MPTAGSFSAPAEAAHGGFALEQYRSYLGKEKTSKVILVFIYW
jgi:hypothetical protein